MTDVIVIGGGVIGLSIAHELAGQGVSVRVLEKGAFGKEASWAGAGMLPPGNPENAKTPESQLRSASHQLWPAWSERLQEETGIDTGYRNCGGLTICLNGPSDELQTEISTWRGDGVTVEEPAPSQVFELEPNLSHDITSAFRLPEMSQVRNPRYLKALVAACLARGVELNVGESVTGFDVRNGRVESVRTPSGRQIASQFCLAGGAWSRWLLESVHVEMDVTPVRGQIVLLSAPSGCLRHIIEVGPRYLVPRPDGRVLVGSTEEIVGFDKRNTAEGIAGLISLATTICPALKDATFEQAWAGLRPGTPTRIPFLSRVPEMDNLTVAAGHFRSGLQMSPSTAVFMRQLILEQKTSFASEPFSLERVSVDDAQKLIV